MMAAAMKKLMDQMEKSGDTKSVEELAKKFEESTGIAGLFFSMLTLVCSGRTPCRHSPTSCAFQYRLHS
jgi:hypothetical protein